MRGTIPVEPGAKLSREVLASVGPNCARDERSCQRPSEVLAPLLGHGATLRKRFVFARRETDQPVADAHDEDDTIFNMAVINAALWALDVLVLSDGQCSDNVDADLDCIHNALVLADVDVSRGPLQRSAELPSASADVRAAQGDEQAATDQHSNGRITASQRIANVVARIQARQSANSTPSCTPATS